MREPTEGKIGRAVLTIALVMATAMLVLAVATLIGLTVRRQFTGPPMQDREAHHAAPPQRGPSEREQP